MDWLNEVTVRLATELRLEVADLLVDARAAETLLEIAGVAAHTSGDRTNAPLLCHVIGRAVAGGADLDDCVRIVHAVVDGH